MATAPPAARTNRAHRRKTKAIDRLYLELSQFASVKTPREQALEEEVAKLRSVITNMTARLPAVAR